MTKTSTKISDGSRVICSFGEKYESTNTCWKRGPSALPHRHHLHHRHHGRHLAITCIIFVNPTLLSSRSRSIQRSWSQSLLSLLRLMIACNHSIVCSIITSHHYRLLLIADQHSSAILS